MPKETKIRHEKKKGLTDEELIKKYEKGEQPIDDMINSLLHKPNPKFEMKRVKRS